MQCMSLAGIKQSEPAPGGPYQSRSPAGRLLGCEAISASGEIHEMQAVHLELRGDVRVPKKQRFHLTIVQQNGQQEIRICESVGLRRRNGVRIMMHHHEGRPLRGCL